MYPGRLTPAKKFDEVAAFCEAVKKVSELDVKVLFCDFPSADIESEKYKTITSFNGSVMDLSSRTPHLRQIWDSNTAFPRKGVLELLSLSNLFVSPSFSESFGLTVLEAASRGNFLVVNEAVSALEELGKKLNAYFLRWDARNFGFDTKEKYNPSEKAYYEEHATKIVNLMRENSVLHAMTMARQRFSPEWVWKNQLEPLLRG